MVKNLFPADTYIVKNATILNNEDRLTLIKLYEPVIGAPAINLYFTLWANLDTLDIISTDYTHHSLMATMRLKLEDILEAREKLEGIGLMKTYLREDSINNYVYELYSPLDPKEFLDNPILATTLESNIGKREFKKLIKAFTIPKVDLAGYKDITSKFSDTFDIINTSEVFDTENIKKVKNIEITVDEKIDINSVLSIIPNDILNHRSISKEIKNLIYKLSFIYNLDEEILSELIRNSVNEKKAIDKDKLRENCHNFYTFENKNSSPSLIYKKQPEYLRKAVSDTSKKSKLIYTFETTTPYDFLTGKNKGVKPSKTDLNLLETLLLDYELNPGVVNVLIDYVLKINENKLTKNFVLTIASQWKRSNINTVEEAIELCKKENKSKKPKTKTIKKEEKPDWYNKTIEENIATEEDIKELEKKLNSL
ncbi:MAG: DnaD domain protein [Bacilli bacterium]|nr:DnaD domain protein [Bacilli bacterium]